MGERQVRRCHSRASEMAAEWIRNDKLKGGYTQKSDGVAFFSEKLCFPMSTQSNLLTSPTEVASCSHWLIDAMWFGESELEPCSIHVSLME